MKLHNIMISRYSAIILTALNLSAGLSGCASEYYKLDNNKEVQTFIDTCEDSGGKAVMQLKYENQDKSLPLNGYVCICKNQQCATGATCNEAGECESNACADGLSTICENDDNHAGFTYECEDGKIKYSTKKACKDKDNKSISCNEIGTDCGECLNGFSACENDEDLVGYKVTCQNGALNREFCTTASCNMKMDDCGNCINERTYCQNDENNNGMMMICKNGELNPAIGTYCTDPNDESQSTKFSCNETNDGCGECKNDVTVCINNAQKNGELKSCSNGRFEEKTIPCGNGVSCENSKSCGECKNGVTRCKASQGVGQLSQCEDGHFTSEEACGEGSNCDDEENCQKCVNGTVRCVNGTDNVGILKTCQNGDYSDKKCTNNYSCNENNTNCGSCKNGAKSCTINSEGIGTVKICKNGKITTTTCPTSCNSANDCGECIDGKQKCENDPSGLGVLYICKDGKWVKSKDCTNVSCKNETSCGACFNDTASCINTQINEKEIASLSFKYCLNGQFLYSNYCSNLGLRSPRCVSASSNIIKCTGRPNPNYSQCFQNGSRAFSFRQESKNDSSATLVLNSYCPKGCNANKTACAP